MNITFPFFSLFNFPLYSRFYVIFIIQHYCEKLLHLVVYVSALSGLVWQYNIMCVKLTNQAGVIIFGNHGDMSWLADGRYCGRPAGTTKLCWIVSIRFMLIDKVQTMNLSALLITISVHLFYKYIVIVKSYYTLLKVIICLSTTCFRRYK